MSEVVLMPSFISRLADGWNGMKAHLPLALVPVITAVLNTDAITNALAVDGWYVGLRLGLPATIVDLWQFVSVPTNGMNIGLIGPDTFPLVLFVLPFALVIRAGLAAGYFGSIHDALETSSYAFVANSRRYFIPFLLYTLIPILFLLPLVLVGVGQTPGVFGLIVVVLLPISFGLMYLFYATPYLIVLRETDLVTALRASSTLALTGGPYLHFAVGFAAFVFLSSVLATVIVVNFGSVGIAIGVVTVAPIGLTANMTAMRFIADIDPESPSPRAWSVDTATSDGSS